MPTGRLPPPTGRLPFSALARERIEETHQLLD